MPRLQPPPGYLTAKEAASQLGVSEALLSRYVIQGKIKRYGPEERKHKFYKASEIEALKQSERVFDEPYKAGQWRLNPSSSLELATPEDMPAIVEISRQLFGDPPIPAAPRLEWQRANPHTFYVLRSAGGDIVGYASLLPMRRETIDRFIRDEITAEEITADDIEPYAPGALIHLYVMAIGIDPRFSQAEKHEYGARLVAGLFSMLLELAAQGIELATITARSQYRDGLRLLRKMGFPQVISPVPGKGLFVVDVRSSGFPIFERYRELLNDWRQQHTAPAPDRPRRRPAGGSAQRPTSTSSDELPGGLVSWSSFAGRHGIARSTVQKAINTGRLQETEGEWKQGRAIIRGAFDAGQQRAFIEAYRHNPNFHQCDNPTCPCQDSQISRQDDHQARGLFDVDD